MPHPAAELKAGAHLITHSMRWAGRLPMPGHLPGIGGIRAYP
ncbi:hypothetical protein ACFSTI_25340 [Rhizorhabdus histidinilytica]